MHDEFLKSIILGCYKGEQRVGSGRVPGVQVGSGRVPGVGLSGWAPPCDAGRKVPERFFRIGRPETECSVGQRASKHFLALGIKLNHPQPRT
jgi:hypothetical protein